jgi:uncharacterized protein (DUF433 family)
VFLATSERVLAHFWSPASNSFDDVVATSVGDTAAGSPLRPFEEHSMALSTTTEQMPLMMDADGVMRVGGTRVTLDTIVTIFEQGATAEEIVQRFPTLDLADVYFAVGYYLRHRVEVEKYLQERLQEIK